MTTPPSPTLTTDQQRYLASQLTSPLGLARLASRGHYDLPPHLLLLNQLLLDVAARRITRLMVFAPPRHGKSEAISHYFPAWYLGTHPDHRVLLSSYGADFAASWGRKARDVLTAYGAFYGVSVSEQSSAADRWDIADHLGGMTTAGVGGSTTGRGADVFLIDDPVKNAEEALSPTYREKIWNWYLPVARTRLEPNGAIILTMTRWHDEDLAGKLLEQMAHGGEQWTVVNLPALAQETDPLGRRPGDALWPERFDVGALLDIRRTLENDFWWHALYMQTPTPRGGSVFQRTWFSRRYTSIAALPAFTMIIQSVDSAFKEGVANDYSVIATWATDGRDYYLLRVWRDRVAYPDLIQAIEDEAAACRAQFGDLHAILIEDKASGQSALQTLKRSTSLPLIGVHPDGSKVGRAESVSPLFQGERVVLPEQAAWLADFIDEHVRFPRAPHDDQVDTSSQALTYLRNRGTLLHEMQRRQQAASAYDASHGYATTRATARTFVGPGQQVQAPQPPVTPTPVESPPTTPTPPTSDFHWPF